MLTTTTAVENALASDDFAVALLFDLPDDGVTNMKLCDASRDITYNGVTYKTSGVQVLNGPRTNRTTTIKADGFEIQLGAASLDAFNLYKGNAYSGRPVSVYIAFVDQHGALLESDSVLKTYEGLLESWSWRDGIKKSTLLVRTSNHWAPFEAANGRFTNDESQQEHFSGDSFFEYGHQKDQPIKWGF